MNEKVNIDESLLTPTLSRDEPQVEAIYSTTALALTAFFGGPFAALIMTGLNSEKLKRLPQDAPYLLLGTVLSLAVVELLYGGGSAASAIPAADPDHRTALLKALSLALFAAAYLLHRRAHRSMRFARLASPNAIPAALICIVVGRALTSRVIELVMS